MPSAARQHAFSHDDSHHESLYQSLEAAANLPSPLFSRFNVSCVRKSRPVNGLNVGILYLTKSHLVFYAHFVTTSPSERRLVFPLNRIQHTRCMRHSRLLPHGILIRCDMSPDYVVAFCSTDEQQHVLSLLRSIVSDAKELASDETASYGDDDSTLAFSSINNETSFPHCDTQSCPKAEHVKVATLRKPRRVKFAPTHYIVEEKKPFIKPSEEKRGDPVIPLQKVMEKALLKVHDTTDHNRQMESSLFCVSAFILMLTIVGVFVALHLLHLRMSMVANHLALHH